MNERPPLLSPSVGVVTVSYRSDQVLPGFLASLSAASSRPLNVVVVDNNANGGEAIEAMALEAGGRYLPLAANIGYGGAMNAGAAILADAEWILLSNPDVVMGADAIDILIAAGASDPAIASVGPAILNDDGSVYPSARAVPSLRTGVGHALFSNIWLGNPWTRAYRNDTESIPSGRDAGWLSGACLLVRASVFRELGGFDPGYFMYFEDVDLGFRLGRAGYRNRYEPAAVVTHSGAHSTTGESARMIEAHHTSARRFLTRKYAGWRLLPVRIMLSIGLAARSAALRRRADR